MKVVNVEKWGYIAGGFDWPELLIVTSAYMAVGGIQGALIAAASKDNLPKIVMVFGLGFGLLGAAQNITAQNLR